MSGTRLFVLAAVLAGVCSPSARAADPARKKLLKLPGEICGPQDQRVYSTDKAVGRVLPNEGTEPCTAFLIPSGALLTAGHCVTSGGLKVVEFNVPKSNDDGSMNHPPEEDRYDVVQESIKYQNDRGGPKGDWAIFNVKANGKTGKTPLQAQGASYTPVQAKQAKNTTLRVTGFGKRDQPPKNLNFAQETGTGPLVDYDPDLDDIVLYRVDATSSNSGSPVSVDGTSNAIAIHVAGTCKVPSVDANGGTVFANAYLWTAIQQSYGSSKADARRPGLPDAICGDDDTRVFSQEKAVGRVRANEDSGAPCTAFIIDGGALLTAGHCVKDGLKRVEFNVPKSQNDGTMTPAAPKDRYNVRQDSIKFSVPESGKGDWAVFRVYANGVTDKTPLEAQQASFTVSATALQPGTTLRLTGFGARDQPKDLNFAQETGTGPLKESEASTDDPTVWYRVDTTSSNSGSPVTRDGTSTAIAIHVAGTCKVHGIEANGGTTFQNPHLMQAIKEVVAMRP